MELVLKHSKNSLAKHLTGPADEVENALGVREFFTFGNVGFILPRCCCCCC